MNQGRFPPRWGGNQKWSPCLWTSFKSIFRQDDLPEELKSWAVDTWVSVNYYRKKKTWDAFWQKMDGLRLQILHGIFSTKKNVSISRPRILGGQFCPYLSDSRSHTKKDQGISFPAFVTQKNPEKSWPQKKHVFPVSPSWSRNPESGIRIMKCLLTLARPRMKTLSFLPVRVGSTPNNVDWTWR